MKKGDFYVSKGISVKGAKEKNGYFINSNGQYIFPRNINFFEGELANYKTEDGIERLNNIGFNMLGGYFCHMNSVIDEEYNIKKYNDELIQKLKIADKEGFLVDSLWMTHIMPDWMKKNYPEFILPGAKRNINYDVNNPEFKKYHELYIKGVMDRLFEEVGKETLGNTLLMMDMSNEPRLEYMSALNFKEFQNQLKRTYAEDIVKLNKIWKTRDILNKEYKNFDEINNYDDIKLLTSKNSRVLLDYRQYNSQRQSGYFEWFSDTVDKYSRGIDFNHYAKFDYGCDVLTQSNYVMRSRVDPETINRGLNTFSADMHISDSVGDKYNVDWRDQSFALDYMKSLDKEKVYVNTEWHSADCGAIDEEPMSKGYMTEALRIATYHGMATSVMWGYIEPGHEEWGRNGALITAQPRAFDEYVRESITIENEMDRVVEFPLVDRKIYILYSMNSITNQGQEYLDMVGNAYESMYFQDLNVGIVTEDMLLNNNIGDMELLVVPGAEYISDAAFNKIQQLADKKMPIVFYGDSLNYNVYGAKRTEPKIKGKVQYLKESSVEQMTKDMKWIMKWAEVDRQFNLIDDKGNHPAYVEARFAKHGDTNIGYAINYVNTEQTFTIRDINDDKDSLIRILRNNKLDDSIIKVTLKPREHVTFNIE